jgi:predicted ester cyclase
MRTAKPRTLLILAGLTLALTLTTGTALARLLFAPPTVATRSPASGPEVTLVRHFYAAVNDALSTGDVQPLDRLVAENLVEHPARAGVALGRASLVETLTALRAGYPNLQLVVEDVRSDGDQVAARIRVDGASGRFLGIPLGAGQVPWGTIDLFRVADGVIAEHWGVPSDAALFTPLTQATIHLSSDARRRVGLERRDFAPGSYWPEELAAGPVLIMGQIGSMTVTIDKPASTPALLVHNAPMGGPQAGEQIGKGVVATLVPGDLLVLPEGARFSTSNSAGTAAAILVLTLEMPAIPGGAPMPDPLPPVGITRQVKAVGMAASIPSDAVVQIGRMALGPGAELPLHTATGPELLVVEDGSLGVGAGDKMAWVQHGSNSWLSGERAPTLQAGDGALVPLGAMASYRDTSATATTVLVLTILPAE